MCEAALMSGCGRCGGGPQKPTECARMHTFIQKPHKHQLFIPGSNGWEKENGFMLQAKLILLFL